MIVYSTGFLDDKFNYWVLTPGLIFLLVFGMSSLISLCSECHFIKLECSSLCACGGCQQADIHIHIVVSAN